MMKRSRSLLALLLAVLLTLLCTGCTMPSFTAAGSEKLLSKPVPDTCTAGHVWYTFPFTAEQANTVFFGDRTYQRDPYGFMTENPFSNARAFWYFMDGAYEYMGGKPESVLGGARSTHQLTFSFFDQQYNASTRSCGIAFEPESGNLLDAITYHPAGDAVYAQVKDDASAKLQALGYTDAEMVFSSCIDWRAMRLLGRALGRPLEDDEFPEHYYVVRYALQSNENAGPAGSASMATFYYTAEGHLRSANINALPEYEVTESTHVRYTAAAAFQLLPIEWYRADCILVDAYPQSVRPDPDATDYADCWTFRFVAPPELYLMSDIRLENVLNTLGIAGRYMEMQCHVNLRTGEVTGGEWVYSPHLIHEYNSKQVLAALHTWS